MPSGNRNDPYANFNFLVEIDGITQAGFSECTGLATESAVIEYRNGNEGSTVRKFPGLTKYPNIVLERGYTDSRELWDWRRAVINGQVERRSGSIVLLDTEGSEVVRFNFREGWPARWEGPALNAKANEIAIETLEIAHEGLSLD